MKAKCNRNINLARVFTQMEELYHAVGVQPVSGRCVYNLCATDASELVSAIPDKRTATRSPHRWCRVMCLPSCKHTIDGNSVRPGQQRRGGRGTGEKEGWRTDDP